MAGDQRTDDISARTRAAAADRALRLEAAPKKIRKLGPSRPFDHEPLLLAIFYRKRTVSKRPFFPIAAGRLHKRFVSPRELSEGKSVDSRVCRHGKI